MKLDLVRGLPRSEENHAANGMALDPATNTLYIAQGGNTNMGAPSNNFALLPEYALSAAILSVDLDAIGNTTYDLPTLDDETRPGTADANDPFGGNDGKNQAKLVPGGPVQVYAPGFRNPYDVVITQAGGMYTIDNGANAGWGDVPVNEGAPRRNCTNAVNEPGINRPDNLHSAGPGYYAGHPNPTRANTGQHLQHHQPPVSGVDGQPRRVRLSGTRRSAGSTASTTFATSTNGHRRVHRVELRRRDEGRPLAAAFDNSIYRIKLNAAGDAVVSKTTLFNNVGLLPLDVVAQGDTEPFPGTIWVADYIADTIVVFEPNDFGGGGGVHGRGRSRPRRGRRRLQQPRRDRQRHQSRARRPTCRPTGTTTTSPTCTTPTTTTTACRTRPIRSPSTRPTATTTSLPVVLHLGQRRAVPGRAAEPGVHRADDQRLDELRRTVRSEQDDGRRRGRRHDHRRGDRRRRQGGDEHPGVRIPVRLQSPVQHTDPFTAHTRIIGPFAGLTPQAEQSMGLFIGTGDQDNYVKIVTSANGAWRNQIRQGSRRTVSFSTARLVVTMPGPDYVDLYLTVDADAKTVQPSYTVTTNGVTGPLTDLGGSEPVPSGWFTGSTGLAIGIISTSVQAQGFRSPPRGTSSKPSPKPSAIPPRSRRTPSPAR